MRVVCWSLCFLAAILQSVSCSGVPPTSAAGVLFRPPVTAPEDHTNSRDGSMLQALQAPRSINGTGDRDFLDDAFSRAVLKKTVETTLKIYKNPVLRQDIVRMTRSFNELFANEGAYEMLDVFTNHMNRMLLVEGNLKMVSKILDIGTMILVDQGFHKVIDREMQLVDRFLEDRLLRLTYVKFGNMMALITTDEEVYSKYFEILNQVNTFLTKPNLRTMREFYNKLSQSLTGTSF